jgi:hypothetical protein
MMINLSASLLSSLLQTLPLNFSYLDPGTGSMMLQILLAGALSTSFFVKSWIRQIREVVRIKQRGV